MKIKFSHVETLFQRFKVFRERQVEKQKKQYDKIFSSSYVQQNSAQEVRELEVLNGPLYPRLTQA